MRIEAARFKTFAAPTARHFTLDSAHVRAGRSEKTVSVASLSRQLDSRDSLSRDDEILSQIERNFARRGTPSIESADLIFNCGFNVSSGPFHNATLLMATSPRTENIFYIYRVIRTKRDALIFLENQGLYQKKRYKQKLFYFEEGHKMVSLV